MTKWKKVGSFLGHVLALTITVSAWLIIVLFTLKCVWFIVFRFLV